MFTKEYHNFKMLKVTPNFSIAEVKVTFLFITRTIRVARSNEMFHNYPTHHWTDMNTGEEYPELRKLEKLQEIHDMLDEKPV